MNQNASLEEIVLEGHMDGRTKREKRYWDDAALDPEVDQKYICDVDVSLCKQDLGRLGGRVLEIGCGVGRLMERGYNGIDVSPNMIEIALKRNHGCYYKLCDGRTIPHQDAYFDVVYSYLLYQHLPTFAVLMYSNEAYRVLKDGGLYLFQFIDGDEVAPFSFHHPKDELIARMQEIGFTDITVEKSKAHELWSIMRMRKGKHE